MGAAAEKVTSRIDRAERGIAAAISEMRAEAEAGRLCPSEAEMVLHYTFEALKRSAHGLDQARLTLDATYRWAARAGKAPWIEELK